MGAKVTPAVKALRRAGVDHTVHEYEPTTADGAGAGLDAARRLDADPARVFKTLIVALERDPARLGVVVAPASGEVDLRAAATGLGAKRAALAERQRAERATGYVLGGISPFGQRRRLPTVVDASASGFPTVYVSGGRRGLEIEVAPTDLVRLLDAAVAAVARR